MTTSSSQKRRHRKRIFACLALLLGSLFAAAASEIALRIYVATRGWTPNCYATGLAFFVPHPTAGYTLRPGLRLKSTTYDVDVNQAGFRGPPIQREVPYNSRRIVVLGGSSVFGYLVGEGQDSCRVMENLINKSVHDRADDLQVEVINAGVPGYNIAQCRARFIADIAPLRPDVVLLYLGWNDTPFLIRENPDELERLPEAPNWLTRSLSRSVLYGFVRYRLFPPKNPVFAPPQGASRTVTDAGAAMFRSELQELIDAVRDSGSTPVISTQLMASNGDCAGMETYLGDTDEQRQANRALGEWITTEMRTAAAENHLLLIDCARKIPCDASLLGDAIHLTAKGHESVAECWVEAMQKVLHETHVASENHASEDSVLQEASQ